MKIRANAVGIEYVRISKNDNGYIQDFLIEVISQKNEIDLIQNIKDLETEQNQIESEINNLV